MVFRFGNEKNAGTTKIPITRNKRTITIATRSKITVMKNHVNGIQFGDGKIMVTSHGFMKMREPAEEKLSKESYIRDHIDYVSRLFGEPVNSISEIKFEPIPEGENEE